MFTHLLVPLDGSPLAVSVLPHLIAFARLQRTGDVVTGVSPPAGYPVDVFDWQLLRAEAEAYLDHRVQRLQTVGVTAESVLVEGQPANCVIDYIHRHPIDLVILARSGDPGRSRLFGEAASGRMAVSRPT